MAIKGPSLSKEVITTAVVNRDPKALANAYAYSVKKTDGGTYRAIVAELPEFSHDHLDFIAAQNELKAKVISHLSTMDELERPVPVGISLKSQIDRAKEVPRHIKKSFGKQMAAE